LPEHTIVKNIVLHETDTQSIKQVIQFLPIASRECYIDYLINNKLPREVYNELELSTNINEILPLLFVSLKLALSKFGDKRQIQQMLLVNSLNDFMEKDKMQKLIVSKRHLKKNNLLSTKENLKEVAK